MKTWPTYMQLTFADYYIIALLPACFITIQNHLLDDNSTLNFFKHIYNYIYNIYLHATYFNLQTIALLPARFIIIENHLLDDNSTWNFCKHVYNYMEDIAITLIIL